MSAVCAAVRERVGPVRSRMPSAIAWMTASSAGPKDAIRVLRISAAHAMGAVVRTVSGVSLSRHRMLPLGPQASSMQSELGSPLLELDFCHAGISGC